MANIFDRMTEWLQRMAFFNGTLDELVEQFSQRLIDGGVPVARVSLGRILMHPVIGLVDVTWEADVPRVKWTVLPRSSIDENTLEEGPFGENARRAMAAGTNSMHKTSWELADEKTNALQIRADLTDPATRDKYPLFANLAASGVTDYLAFTMSFGKRAFVLPSGYEFFSGASVSFATKRRSGFSERELEGINRLILPLVVTVRVLTEQFLATELMEAYLGKISGQSVLNGQIALGDVREIDCALVYSDMHGSTALSQRLSSQDYVATLNRYFDCVAGAVQDHGGEVLKFVGDGLLAIFPFDGRRRLPEDMCTAALSAAQEAFRRHEELATEDQVSFGIGLHMGAAVFGNVGTEKRLDCTVTGTSVAVVSRLEGLTRDLDAPLLATADFAKLVSDKHSTLGSQTLRGIDARVDVVAFEPLG